MAKSDILFAIHGAALAHEILLPPWGVAIELKAYGHGSNHSSLESMDFFADYCNLAQVFGRSHIS